MSENKLLDLSFEFAVAIANLVDVVTAPNNHRNLCGRIRRMLIAVCNTLKENK